MMNVSGRAHTHAARIQMLLKSKKYKTVWTAHNSHMFRFCSHPQ